MKKTLVALAALASVSAFAQSSVTLYGRMDLGHNNITTTNDNGAGVVTKTKATTLAGNQSGITTMRLGVRGTEDLGGGLNLGFVFESAIQPDEAAAFGNTRLANLSLTGGFGRVIIGTYDNAMDTVRSYNQAIYSVPGGDFLSNMFNISAAGAPAATFAAFGGNTIPVGLRQRSQNSVAWGMSTNGFTFGIGTVNESTKTTTNGVTTGAGKTSGYMISAGYANGPLATNLAIGSAKATAGAVPAGAKLNDWAAAVSYDLGIAKPYFVYERASTSLVATPGVPGKLKGNGWVLGSTFPMGSFAPYVAVSRGSYKNDVGGPPVFKAKVTGAQVGVRYSLSKRSTVYAAFGNDKIRDDSAPATSMSTKRSGYNLGLRHDF